MANVQMPRLSDSMETGRILHWLKKEGEDVVKGEPLVEIESDKANIEVEAYASGKLSKILVKEGDSAPIGAVIAEIGSPSVEAPKPQATNPRAHVEQAEKAASVPARIAPAAHEEGGGEQYPQGGTDDRTEVGAAAQAALKLIRRPAEQSNGERQGERQKVSPVARRIAEEQGVELSSVTGTGPGGRITKEDVEAAAAAKSGRSGVAAVAPAGAVSRPEGESEMVELSKMQATVATRLAQSKFSAPHFYVTSEVAMDDAVRLRQMFNEAVDKADAISVNDLVVKAVALALTKFPAVNASWADGRIERKREINIGIAVGLADGLIVPVLRNAERKSLKEIAAESRQLIDRARSRKAGAQDYQGNTFTISNLGMYDVDQFTAIINPPDSAILAVGSIEEKPVVKAGQVVPGKRMRVTLSVDHRVFYGVTAAQFLQEVKRLLQSPMALVL